MQTLAYPMHLADRLGSLREHLAVKGAWEQPVVAVQLVTRLTVGGRARRGTGPAGELVGVMGVDGMWTAGELGELVVARAWVMEVGGLKRGVVATATAK